MYSDREEHTPEEAPSPDGSSTSAISKKSAGIKSEYRSPPSFSPDRSLTSATNEEFAKLQIKLEYSPTPEPPMQGSTSSLKRSATDELSDRKCDGSESFGEVAVRRCVRVKKEEERQDSGLAMMEEVRQPLLHNTQDATLITN